MKSTAALLVVSAILVLAQAASATSSFQSWYSAASCTGKAYCFPQETEAPRSNPVCPDGYKLDKVAKNCYKDMPDTCPTGCSESDDGKNCLSCDAGFKLTQNEKCVKPCKDGYSLTTYGGKRYCVQDCPSTCYPYGDKCMSYTQFISNSKCDDTCDKTKYTFCPSESSDKPYSSSLDSKCYADAKFGAVLKAQDLKVKASVEGKFRSLLNLDILRTPKCKCIRSFPRDIYEQEVQEPKKTPINTNIMTTPATCAGGAAPDASFTCPKPCPTGCSTSSTGGCFYGCPNGFKVCTYNGVSFCATKNKIINADSCAVLSAAWQFVDRTVKCPVPEGAKVKVSLGLGLGL